MTYLNEDTLVQQLTAFFKYPLTGLLPASSAFSMRDQGKLFKTDIFITGRPGPLRRKALEKSIKM